MNIKIIDTDTGNPIPYASVVGYKNGDPTGQGTSANDSGIASFSYPEWSAKGVTDIQITSVGYNSASLPLNGDVDGDTIDLSAKSGDLGEVIVTAAKKGSGFIVLILILILILAVAASKN